jgi:hypothetical protein
MTLQNHLHFLCDNYAEKLLLWNEAVKNYKTDTGVKKKSSITHNALRVAKTEMDDAILEIAGAKRYYLRNGEVMGKSED